ncbi:MAG: metallophosphoesterase family protein [Gemmataceae bacterium]|nr:metallophosphoesterase family protein [Gemmataceae bacterium]
MTYFLRGPARWLTVLLLGWLSFTVQPTWADEKTQKPEPVSPAELHRPSRQPDRIILTIKGDPARTQAVTWRTDTSVKVGYAELGPCDESGAFAGYARVKTEPKTRRFQAVTTPLKSDLNEAHYHTVEFTDLEPNTQYLYRVGDGVNWSEWFEFRTASDKPAPFTFLYLGDAQNSIKTHWSRVIRRAFRDAPDARLLLHAGDLVNRANSDAEWGEWFQGGGWINGMIPSIATPGNHEWFNANAQPPKKDAEGKEIPADETNYLGTVSVHWRPQFAFPENGPENQKEITYWLDYQGVRFISLNSNESKAKSHADKEAQVAWLERVLSDNPNRWTIITFHHPVYSSGKNRDNPELRRLWKPVFDKYNVDLVLTGHDHTYARTGLVSNGSESPAPRTEGKGTIYCVSVAGPKMYNLNKKEQMLVTAEDTQLYQIIRIDGDKLRFEARTAAGRTYDLFELHKRADGTKKLVQKDELTTQAAGGR